MARQKALSVLEPRTLEPITSNQQTFIEYLLSGRNISQAALLAGISRRTATYWLADPAHRSRWNTKSSAYSSSRNSRTGSRPGSRICMSWPFKAMEDALAPDTPPAIRFQAAKFLYEKHLEHLCKVQGARSPQDLVEKQTKVVDERDHFQKWTSISCASSLIDCAPLRRIAHIQYIRHRTPNTEQQKNPEHRTALHSGEAAATGHVLFIATARCKVALVVFLVVGYKQGRHVLSSPRQSRS